MTEPANATRSRLIDATVEVICAAKTRRDVTAREIARVADISVSGLYQHYPSLNALIIASAKKLYAQVNHERMTALQAVMDRSRPNPAPLRDILAALIGPPVRWSLDPKRPYAVFKYINTMPGSEGAATVMRPLIDQIESHRAVITYLRQSAPWFDDVEIGWRVNAALGVRSQVLRESRRTMLLTQNRIDLSDPDVIIELVLDVIAPMFAPPLGPSSR
jgi:AcrR family transcriptional regulator